MFTWLVSLLVMFTNHGPARTLTSVGPNNPLNTHVRTTENAHPDGSSPPDADGQGSGGGSTGSGGGH